MSNNAERRLVAENAKKVFKVWCHFTTCAGIIDIHNSRTICGKVFWLAFVAFCLCLTIWQTSQTLKEYVNDNPYKSVITIRQNSTLKFPNVTICNFNFMDKNRINVEGLDKVALSYALEPLKYSPLLTGQKTTIYAENISYYENKWNKLKKMLRVSNIYEVFRKYGHSCEDSLLHCSWGFDAFNCCEYATETVTNFGLCWIINYKNVFQQFPGVFYGMSILVNPKIKSYFLGDINNAFEEGIALSIGYEQVTDLPTFKVVQPGMHSWLSLTAKVDKVKTYETPLYKPLCNDNVNLSYLNIIYSKDNCEADCWGDLHFRHCNCVFSYHAKQEFKVCEAIDIISSDTCKNIELYQKELAPCLSTCLNPCHDRWSVQVSHTSAKLIGDRFKADVPRALKEFAKNFNMTVDDIRDLIYLNIYFSSFEYTEIETGETNPLFVTIANFGGQLSLWLGISIVTIVQAIWYLFFCICYTLAKKSVRFDNVEN